MVLGIGSGVDVLSPLGPDHPAAYDALAGLDPTVLAGPSAFEVSAPAPGTITELATPTVQWAPSTSPARVTQYAVVLDGATVATLPWRTTQWTANALPNGPHTVQVIATDMQGRQTATDPVTVNVQVPQAAAPAPAPAAALGRPTTTRTNSGARPSVAAAVPRP